VTSKADRSDPTLMLAIAAVCAALAAWQLLSSIRVDQLLALAPSVAPIALGATAIASALATQRLRATRRTIRSRIALAAVPADQFEASPDAVLRLAGQLARADRSVAGWLDRRAAAVRVRLTCDAERRLIYVLEAPERSRGLLRSALRGYKGVELREASEVVGDPSVGDVVLRTELTLARPSVEPLARLGLDPDPLQPFAAAMASLRPDRGEAASVCLDLLPAAGRRRARLRRRLRREARRLHGERRDLLERLEGNRRATRSGQGTDELVERRAISGALDAKMRDSGPLFEAQVLLRCQAAERPRAKEAMQGLLAAFEPLAERNWLRPSGLPIPGLAFLGADLLLRRRSFDRRFESGLFRPARRTILTARELAGFLKPPTAHCVSENVLRSGALLSPPPPLPTFKAGEHDLIPLGRVSGEAGERIVGVRAADTFFTYIAGRSRYGKTETAIAQFVHLVRSGHGGLFLDPHGDGIERALPYLTEPDVAERVVRIDLGPGASAAQPGWNLFALDAGPRDDVEGRVEAIVDAFASALEWGERSTRAINLTTQAAAALAAIAKVLPPEATPTIFQLPTLLSDAEWRRAVLPFLPRPAQRFWMDRFPLLAPEAITPVTNMVDRLRASTPITTLLGQSRSTFRVRQAMDEGWIVLACPGSGGTRDRLLANLLLFDVLYAARSRADLPPAARKLFWLALDEVQTYDGAASENLAGLLEQSPKFGIRALLLNQNPERLSPATLNALLTNRSHLLGSALNSRAAGLLTKEWGRQTPPEVLTTIDRYRFVAQVTHRGSLSAPFALGGVRVEDALGPPTKAQSEGGGGTVATKGAGEVLSHLDTLDDRIHAELRQRSRDPDGADREDEAEPTAAGPLRIARSRG
jgi:hypothetical protein